MAVGNNYSPNPLSRAPADLSRLTNRRFEAVIFDMDETLIHSMPALIKSWTVFGKTYDLTPDQLEGLQGMPNDLIIAKLLPPDLREQAIELIERLEVEDGTEVVPHPGAMRALQVLPKHRVAIATSASEASMQVRFGASGLPRPKVIVHRDLITHGKPNPEIFLLAADELGVRPENCLVVEDAPAGIKAAKSASMASLAVQTTASLGQLNDPDGWVENLAQVDWLVTDDGISLQLLDDA